MLPLSSKSIQNSTDQVNQKEQPKIRFASFLLLFCLSKYHKHNTQETAKDMKSAPRTIKLKTFGMELLKAEKEFKADILTVISRSTH